MERHTDGTASSPVGQGPAIGISAALATAFAPGGTLDVAATAEHARSCLGRGCDSVTICGTTGEGASLDADERRRLHAELVSAGIDPRRIVVGICATAVGDAVRQAEEAAATGASALLIPPPFYFKGVEQPAVEAWFDALLSRIAALKLPALLYHIPQVTGVPIHADTALRLKRAHGDAVHGVKDSGGDWPTSLAFLERTELAVFIGDERFLAEGVKRKARGSISGLANLVPDRLARILSTGDKDDGIDRLVEAVISMPVVPAVKYLLSGRTGNPIWRTVRPPLRQLSGAEVERVEAMLRLLA